MGIGNLGITEILVLVVLVLLFFGPQRLPEIARGLGKAMREFKKGMNEVQREFEEMERRQREDSTEEERARSRRSGPEAGETVEPPGRKAADGRSPAPEEPSPRDDDRDASEGREAGDRPDAGSEGGEERP